MTAIPVLREGDPLPTYNFIGADGAAWSSDEHLGVSSPGTPLVLILHRHLA